MTRTVTDEQLAEWLNFAQLVVDYDYANFSRDFSGDRTPPELSFDNITGRTKYVRVVASGRGSRGVWCFVGLEDGNVWKADGWKKPALNFPRGNIYEDDHGLQGAKWTSLS